jgi:hypothetical protein
MRHLTEEELVEHYFSEGENRIVAETHLRICGRCEQAFEELDNVLGVRGPEPPPRQPGYGDRVWQSIEGPLRPYQPKRKQSLFTMPRLVFAGACLAFLVAAFVAGRVWERMHTHPTVASNPPASKERVLLFVLDNHLDRSERLLVQLNHAADGGDATDVPWQAEARQLLPDNRLYRQSIGDIDDPLLAGALDHLERVLVEIANSPGDLSNEDIARMEKEMNTDSLLFQIRVLRERTSRQQPNATATRKGTI